MIDKLLSLTGGGGSGGGGGGDLTTCTLTVSSPDDLYKVKVTVPNCIDAPPEAGDFHLIDCSPVIMGPNSTVNFTVPLYKGGAVAYFVFVDSHNVEYTSSLVGTVTGNADNLLDKGMVMLHGDCTVNITGFAS